MLEKKELTILKVPTYHVEVCINGMQRNPFFLSLRFWNSMSSFDYINWTIVFREPKFESTREIGLFEKLKISSITILFFVTSQRCKLQCCCPYWILLEFIMALCSSLTQTSIFLKTQRT